MLQYYEAFVGKNGAILARSGRWGGPFFQSRPTSARVYQTKTRASQPSCTLVKPEDAQTENAATLDAWPIRADVTEGNGLPEERERKRRDRHAQRGLEMASRPHVPVGRANSLYDHLQSELWMHWQVHVL